ncbi:cytochrome b [Devosia sediminis]|uniref:Cytochrome b/b6 domain-containing protein n=1 Tax=Devosia sediminis TaxID=2798801 RepID=A0A934MLU7_9HYPH|nr:cytochrome b/b6 domain-containing protein [Devosia sediminis]MBJ3785011.1 cytochrome b/b6 domain-containing protein [Devosia sediminis]
MPQPRAYSGVQIALHWIIAALLLVQLTINTDMQRAFAQRLSSGTLPENTGAIFHAAIGILILVLALIRLSIRTTRGVPAPHDNHPLINMLSHATHLLLYGFLFFMPITGALAWFTGIELAGVMHELGRLVLIPAILLHLGGALFEELVLNKRVIKRMVRAKLP